MIADLAPAGLFAGGALRLAALLTLFCLLFDLLDVSP